MKQEPFESVVERHGPTVLRVCRAVVGPVAADDAWSETFLAALQAYPGLQPDSNVEAWLVTIAHRKSVDQLRHLSRQPVPVSLMHGGNDPPERPEGVDEVALGQALARGLDEHSPLASLPDSVPGQAGGLDPWPAVLALPLRQRQAVAYHHVAGLPYTDVAALLNCSVVAARRAAADGIAALRSILQQETS